MPKVLIIDDDEAYCSALSRTVTRLGHEAFVALSLGDGMVEANKKCPDIIFLDVRMPDGNGVEFIPRFQGLPSSPEIIIITGVGDPDSAELAIRSGVWAYVQKGASIKDVILPFERALQYRLEKESSKPQLALKREAIIGNSPQIASCLDYLALSATSEAGVLITGETGTGKELFARAIHQNSPRAANNFIVVDCAAIPENLVESMLFGHEKGAFTGADSTRTGLIKDADGGTLFLDEVGELPLMAQKSFLRALQERSFRPVGGNKEEKSDFRLLAATNKTLEKLVEAGQFRQDLLFRIQTLKLELPPLRDRLQDIKELTVHYMVKKCDQYKMETKGFSPDFFEAMSGYDWPGNVREMINTIESLISIYQHEPTLYSKHLPLHIRVPSARQPFDKFESSPKGPEKAGARVEKLPTLKDAREEALAEVEKKYLHDLMPLTNWNIKKACHISGLSRSRLYHLMKKYKIERSD